MSGYIFEPDAIIAEFDAENRIVHLTARKRSLIKNMEDGKRLSERVRGILDKYLPTGRVFMITDYTKIVIDPSLLNLYCQEMKEIIDKYIFPGGVARYGLDIGRITAQLGHSLHIGGNPNLFTTKEEAFEYIINLKENSDRPNENDTNAGKESLDESTLQAERTLEI